MTNKTFLFSSIVNPTTFIEEKNNKNRNVYFIKGYSDKICVGIYDKNMYPLLIAGVNENFEILTISLHVDFKYILRKYNDKILGIYDCNGKKVFVVNDNQEIKIASIKEKSFVITVLEKDKPTILYDVLNKKEILKSTYLNTIINIDEIYYSELQENKIKAIYNRFDNKLIAKSDLGSLEPIKESYSLLITYIKEIDNTGKCHKIYIYKSDLLSFDKLYADENFELSLEFLHSNNVILGKYNNTYKYIVFNRYNGSINWSKTLTLCDGEYLKVPKSNSYLSNRNNKVNLLVMFKGKCIKILDDNLDELLSIDYEENSNNTHYFEFENKFIKEIKNEYCIAFYDLSGTLLIKTDRLNENIVTCKRVSTDNPTFFILNNNNKCIMIKRGDHYLKERTDITYKLWTSYDNELIGGYIVKNGKNIGIFDFNLHTIVCFDSSDNNTTIEAIKYGVYDTVYEDRQDYPYKVKYLKVIYLVYDPKCSKVYNEKNELLLEVDKDSYLKPYENDYLLLCTGVLCDKVYSLKDCEISNTLSTNSKNQFIFPYKSKRGFVFFEIIDLKSKEHTGLYVKEDNTFSKISDKYEEIFDFDDFILVKNSSKKFTVIELPQYYPNNKFNTHILCNIKGSLKLNIEDKNFPYIYNSNLEDSIYSIYSIDKNGFEKLLTSDSHIEVGYINDNMFFETDKKIYNKVGNIIYTN